MPNHGGRRNRRARPVVPLRRQRTQNACCWPSWLGHVVLAACCLRNRHQTVRTVTDGQVGLIWRHYRRRRPGTSTRASATDLPAWVKRCSFGVGDGRVITGVAPRRKGVRHNVTIPEPSPLVRALSTLACRRWSLRIKEWFWHRLRWFGRHAGFRRPCRWRGRRRVPGRCNNDAGMADPGPGVRVDRR